MLRKFRYQKKKGHKTGKTQGSTNSPLVSFPYHLKSFPERGTVNWSRLPHAAHIEPQLILN